MLPVAASARRSFTNDSNLLMLIANMVPDMTLQSPLLHAAASNHDQADSLLSVDFFNDRHAGDFVPVLP